MKEAATAVAFTPASSSGQRYLPVILPNHHLTAFRLLAVGLETGEILIHTSTLTSPNEYKTELTLDAT